MTTVYVAGASAEIATIEHWMARVRAAGLTVAYDWCANIRAVGDANPRHATNAQRLDWSLTDIEAAIASDVFWLLVPSAPTVGAWCELGAVWAYRRYVTRAPRIVVSGDWRASIFTSLADERYESHEAAFERIAGEVRT